MFVCQERGAAWIYKAKLTRQNNCGRKIDYAISRMHWHYKPFESLTGSLADSSKLVRRFRKLFIRLRNKGLR